MKALLIAIFKAMQRKKLGTPSVRTSTNTFRTNNVVQMDRRTSGTATGRKPSKLDQYYAEHEARFDDGYDWARRSAESAWPQPNFGNQEAPKSENHTPNFHPDVGAD